MSSTGVCTAVLRSESAFRRHLVIQHGLQLHTYARGSSPHYWTVLIPPDELLRRRLLLSNRQGGRAAVRRDIHRQTSGTSRPPGVFSARGEAVLPPPPRCVSSPSMPAQQPLLVPPSILLFRYMPPPPLETPQLPASLSFQASRSSLASPAMSVDSKTAWGSALGATPCCLTKTFLKFFISSFTQLYSIDYSY